MFLFADILAWVVIVVGGLRAAALLAPLAIARLRVSGAHAAARLTEPGARSEAWRQLREHLLIVSTPVAALAGAAKDHAAMWLVGIALSLAVIWEFGSCLGLTEPGARSKAWRQLRHNLIFASGAAFALVSGWKHDLAWWPEAIVIFLLAAPDVDSWLRARLSRGSGDPTTDSKP
jgi:hypothetical protein